MCKVEKDLFWKQKKNKLYCNKLVIDGADMALHTWSHAPPTAQGKEISIADIWDPILAIGIYA